MGGFALGKALSRGNNISLVTLRLDYNTTLGNEGVINLCRGLRTNKTLKQLILEYCSITVFGAEALAGLLANQESAVEVLKLGGNRLAGEGLQALCAGLKGNTKLTTLSLADNALEFCPEVEEGLTLFKDCLLEATSAITSVDLMYNRIGSDGARILLPAVEGNKKIDVFRIDISADLELFEKINKQGGGKKKKGKGGGKKKK